MSIGDKEKTERNKDLSDSDYIKILLDSNYKEAINTWTRTGYLLAFNSVLFGFYITYIKDHVENVGKPEALSFCILGIVISSLNVVLVWISVHYNKAWHKEFVEYVRAKSNSGADNWVRFQRHVTAHENLPFPWVHTSAIAKIISVFVALLWLIAVTFYLDKIYEPTAKHTNLSACIKMEGCYEL